jgi:hypothetical protein
MNEDICQIVPATTAITNKVNWQNILIMVGLTVLFLFLCYFFYKFVSHTNKRFKMVETAINQMNDKLKEKSVLPGNPFQHLFAQAPPIPPIPPQGPPVHAPIHPVPVKATPPPPPPQAEVVVDSRVLDKELTEELKELDASVEKHDEPEGRVDVIPENKEPVAE